MGDLAEVGSVVRQSKRPFQHTKRAVVQSSFEKNLKWNKETLSVFHQGSIEIEHFVLRRKLQVPFAQPRRLQ